MVVQDVGPGGKGRSLVHRAAGRSGRHVDRRPAGGRRTWGRPRPARNERLETLGRRPGNADAHGRRRPDVPIARRCGHQHRHDHDERDQNLRARQPRPVRRGRAGRACRLSVCMPGTCRPRRSAVGQTARPSPARAPDLEREVVAQLASMEDIVVSEVCLDTAQARVTHAQSARHSRESRPKSSRPSPKGA